MKKVERNLFTFLFHGLLYIFQQIFASFEANAYSDCRVKDGHLCTLLGSKETKDS